MQILKDLVHGRMKVYGLQSGHHDVKGHVFNDVEAGAWIVVLQGRWSSKSLTAFAGRGSNC